MSLDSLQTPCLLLDKQKLLNNINRLNNQLARFNVSSRPHLKTLKSVDAARYMLGDLSAPCTVSTLQEARQFAQAGCKDITYAVGISEHKLPEILDLQNQGVTMHIIMDSFEQAQFVHAFCRENDCQLSSLIEIDCDGKRAGIKPGDPQLIAIAKILQSAELFSGVLTHAGGAYDSHTLDEIRAMAQQEQAAVRDAASKLNKRQISCDVISVGSTPTALLGEGFEQVTEVRAGVYASMDLVMADLGVCQPEDIALSVLTRVIGHNKEKNWLILDAGWMALSRDLGLAPQRNGYGQVCDEAGHTLPGLYVNSANQEHGIVALPEGLDLSLFSIGTLLRILPNHACATAAQHAGYQVISNDEMDYWPRFGGW
ncbi:alanine racemase [Pseudoalteromonas rubra]|uniref:Metal activated pyridoxal enzyme n=1 Tax=Pseudoalteromonas rubra TaxID=43658 RepID=A0A5S3X4U6_9GAMM|nr:alanine racemase [Pseudoalteromonas rubra]TMP39592.1 metal activated pyridoxal enzyme [Pseudoalteromonas rubra]